MSRILVVEDETALARLLVLELTHEGYEVETAADGVTALQMALVGQWNLILMDIMIPHLTGIQVLKEIRKNLFTPVIFLSAKNTEQDIIEGFDAGADDYLTKPFNTGELLARIRVSLRRGERQKKLQELSFRDSLTGLLNRRGFGETAKLIFAANRQLQRTLALMMIDVDNFKNYNDTYGHPAGDSILQSVAEQMAAAVSGQKTILCRFGGEEFIVLLSDCTVPAARAAAGKICASVESLALKSGAGASHPVVTVSIGLAAAIPEAEQQIQDFVNRADKALYMAKAAGKNRVVTVEEGE